MRRLLVLLSALLLAWFAWRLLPGEEAVAPWNVRDFVIVALAAALLAGWRALPLPWFDRDIRAWPAVGRALFVGGVVTALVAGLAQIYTPAGAPIEPLIPVVWIVGATLTVVGAWLRGPVKRYAAPAFRWVRGRQGTLVRRASTEDELRLAGLVTWNRLLFLLLALVIVAGGVLRVSGALRGETVCAPAECTLLADVERLQDTLLIEPLAALYTWLGASSLVGLRLALASVSTLLLPALAFALWPITTAAGTLLGVTLAAFSLWPPLTGASADPWLEASLLLLLVMAGASRGQHATAEAGAGSVRVWAVAGLALGLLVGLVPAGMVAWLFWLLAMSWLLLWKRPHAVAHTLVLVGAAAAGAALAPESLATLSMPLAGGLTWREAVATAGALAQETIEGAGTLLAAGAIVGIGALLRARRHGLQLLIGAALTLALVLRLGLPNLNPSGYGLDPGLALLVPWLLLGAGVAGDQLMRISFHAWKTGARSAFRAGAALSAAVVLLVVVQAPALVRSLRAPATTAVANTFDREALAAAEFVSALTESQTQPVVLVPPPLLDHPALRVAAADSDIDARLTSWSAANIPFSAEAPGGLVYLVPPTNTAALNWLRSAYPDGTTLPLESAAAAPQSPLSGEIPDSFARGTGVPALVAFQVSPEDAAASLGLTEYLYAGVDWGSSGEAIVRVTGSAFDFGWAESPPLPAPFSAEWIGSLLVPETAVYTFVAEVDADALLSLQLDHRLLLDTSAGLAQWSERLPAGAYQMVVRYRSGAEPGNVRLLWQRTGQAEAQPIPATALHSPALPLQGLLATLTAGATWDGALLDQRKDPLLVAPTGVVDGPVSVVWQGQLGVPRAGEYLIGVQADDSVVVSLAGQTLIERTGPPDLEAPQPAEGSIWLERGWVPFSVRTVHAGTPAPAMTLYWQAPGTGPQTLGAEFFVPLTGPLQEADLPLPSLPAADALLGDEEFALSRDPGIWQPLRRVPPQDLPLLPLERVWVTGVCGDGAGQFNSPRGLTVDQTGGKLYVADTGNRRVVSLALDGSDFQVVPVEGLEEPVDVAVTPAGDLLVLDGVAPKLITWSPALDVQSELALTDGFYRPRGLSVDALGQILIADTGGARSALLAPDGTLLTQFGGPGSTLGSGQPVDVVGLGTSTWAIAAQDGRLWQLEASGSLTAILPTDTIVGPHLAVFDGRIFLSDPARRQVLMLAGSGRPLGALADEGAFLRPTGVAVWPAVGKADSLTLAVADAEACSVSAWLGVVE